MKRVLYVELNEDGTVGGSHRIQADLVTRLPDGFEPVVLHYEDNPWARRLAGAGVEVHTWDDVRRREVSAMQAGGRLTTVRVLAQMVWSRRRFLREHRIDLLHLNNSPFQGRDDWLPAARLAGVPCAVYAMGDAMPEPSAVRRWLMRRFDLILPLSRLVLESLADNGVPRDRMVLAYPGMDIGLTERSARRPAAEVRTEFGVPDGGVLAVMVGNLRHWKGQHVVVEAVGLLTPDERRALTVLLVGDIGPLHEAYTDELRQRIGELALGDTVRIVGHRDDVPDLLEAADIAIHASVIPEPFGLVVLEGMAHGCAMVAAGAGGPVEMLTPESGLLYDSARPPELAAHLRLLLTDPAARAEYGRQARRRARDFDIREHVGIVTRAYRSLLRLPPAASPV